MCFDLNILEVCSGILFCLLLITIVHTLTSCVFWFLSCTDVALCIALYNMLCLLPGPLAYWFLPVRFIPLHVLQNLSIKARTGEIIIMNISGA